jgi:cytochrome c-type biogenesis protein
VSSGSIAYAVTIGMVATVNPCGFALLPAYLSAFVGQDDRPVRSQAVGRALVVSAALTAGFVTVFGLLGIVFGSALGSVLDRAPWFTIVIGLGVLAIGVALASGRQFTLPLPKLERGGSSGTLVSMYLYGVSYAVASLSCSIATFLAATSTAVGNAGARLATFVAYGVGMGLVIAVLTVAVALAQTGLIASFRSMLPQIHRVAGGLMIVAGAYVAYYGVYEVRVLQHGYVGHDPVIDAAKRIQLRLESLMPNVGNYGWYVFGAVVLIGAAVAWSTRPQRAPS